MRAKSIRGWMVCTRRYRRAGAWGLLLALGWLWPAASLAMGPRSNSEGAGPENVARPVISIPVQPLGYTSPGILPEFYSYAMVSLHFVNNGQLLFSFDVKGLLERDDSCPNADTQRKVRAVILDLPSGKVVKQADWQLFDFGDYLWRVDGGRFLLRRCMQLDLLDANLTPKLLVQAHSPILNVQFSPDHSILEEQETGTEKPTDGATQEVMSSQLGEPASVVNVNFIRMEPPAIFARGQIPAAASIPIVPAGILESLSSDNNHWYIDLVPFRSGDAIQHHIVSFKSMCPPALYPLAHDVFAAVVCPASDASVLRGYTTAGGLLWQKTFPPNMWMPRILLSPDGTHFAVESVRLRHPHAALDPVHAEDVDAQIVDIFDIRTGVPVGSLRTTPAYTAGKNVDFSPDGSRIAVLHNGVIEVYALTDLNKNPPPEE